MEKEPEKVPDIQGKDLVPRERVQRKMGGLSINERFDDEEPEELIELDEDETPRYRSRFSIL